MVESPSPLLASSVALTQPQVESQIIKNRHNIPVLYGYAPIQGAFGRMDGPLVVELDARSILQREYWVKMITLGIFFGILLLTWSVVWYLAQSLVVRPTLALNTAAKNLANRHRHWDC